MTEIKTFRRTLGALSGWIFPILDDPPQPIDMDTVHGLMVKAVASGWKNQQVILTSYQHAGRDTMLAVMNEPTKLTERAVAGRR